MDLEDKIMEQLEKELIEFLKHIMEVHTDKYGQLEICDTGDDLDPTVERVVKDYLREQIKAELKTRPHIPTKKEKSIFSKK